MTGFLSLVFVLGLFYDGTVTPSPTPVRSGTPTAAYQCPAVVVTPADLEPEYYFRCRQCWPSTATPTSSIPVLSIPSCGLNQRGPLGPGAPTFAITATDVSCTTATVTATVTRTPAPAVTSTSQVYTGYHFVEFRAAEGSWGGFSGRKQIKWSTAMQGTEYPNLAYENVCGSGSLRGWVVQGNWTGHGWINTQDQGINSDLVAVFDYEAAGQFSADKLLPLGITHVTRSWPYSNQFNLILEFDGTAPRFVISRAYALCYGGSTTATPMPSPLPSGTPTPVVGLYGCNQPAFRDKSPAAAIIGGFTFLPGSCYAIVPAMSLQIPSLFGSPAVDVSVAGFSVCTQIMEFPTLTILGWTLPIEVILVPLVGFLFISLLRL